MLKKQKELNQKQLQQDDEELGKRKGGNIDLNDEPDEEDAPSLYEQLHSPLDSPPSIQIDNPEDNVISG